MSDWLKTTSQDYRRGYVEALEGDRDAYLLRAGASSIADYEQGYSDGLYAMKLEELDADELTQ